MSAWPSSGRRTRPSRCRPGPARWMSCWPPALEDATVPGGRDDLQSQLDALTAGHDVDDELARMKAQLPAPAPTPAIEGPATESADPPPPPGRPATS